ncbi:MAG TPA: DUF3142 domain-containing protein [Blastocatellia bacterium]|nr:DUF3142 domain-containing protein [Blastocatellia bacterium]
MRMGLIGCDRSKLIIILTSAMLGLLFLLAWRYEKPPRAWEIEDLPIAFWAWQSQAPEEADLQRAIAEARANALFLRAGQIDFEGDRLRRIRALRGEFPRPIKLHLVYNGTRSFLSSFERIEPLPLAAALANLYREDTERAQKEGARVIGIQLDIDAPTRLLGRYGEALRLLRERLPPDAALSITGLPTWIDSPAINSVLAAVDFWIPQCYGARIPERLDQVFPISSPRSVKRAIIGARRLKRPFYAGLAAYGYAIHYARDGSLIALRGDLNPALVVRSGDLELIERRPFAETEPSEWRYVYRARNDCVLDGLVIRAGESLMLDMPNAETLRACARIVRQNGGEGLLGICIFRLPGSNDPTTLSIGEIVAALNDRPAAIACDARIGSAGGEQAGSTISLTIANSGAASSLLGEGAMSVELHLPPRSLRGVSLNGFTAHEMLCAIPGIEPRVCGAKRANRLRLHALLWRSGDTAQANIHLTGKLPQTVHAAFRILTDDGREWVEEKSLPVKGMSE